MTTSGTSRDRRPRPDVALRVTHLAKWAPPARGGVETVVRELTAAMAGRTNLDVECCCYAPRTGTRATAPNVTLRQFRTRLVVASAPVSFPLLLHWLRARRRADVVHVHIPNPWAALLVLLLPTRAAVVVSVHGASTRHRLLRRGHDALVDRLLRRADAVLASARTNATLFGLDRYGTKVHVVPYGVDPSRLGGPGDAGPADDPGGVVFCGRLVYYKGLETLIAAAGSIRGRVTIIGDGPLYAPLRRQVAEAGLGDRVRFVRDADDRTLGEHLRRCAVLVMPSSTTSESFGLSMLEAMALGRPVVVTEVGTGLDEVVRDADSGRIVPPGDPEALAAAVNGLLDDPSERARLAANGLRAFARTYTHRRMTDEVLRVYRQVTERPSTAAAAGPGPGGRPAVRLALAAASGGHLTELLSLRPAFDGFSHFFVLNRTQAPTGDRIGRVYWMPDYGTGGRGRRVLALLELTARSVVMWLRERPNVLITTGPFTGFPLAVLIRAAGGKVIYVECSAQVVSPSRSGRAFHWLADRFFVQWESLLPHYPKAEYEGPLL